MNEIINGVMQRKDKEEFLKSTTFGIIPAGSGNGFVMSLTDYTGNDFGTLEATYSIVRGERRMIDLTELDLEYMQNEEFSKVYSFLSVSWAILSDIDINSESLRCFNLGHSRFVIWGTLRFLFVREYQGTLTLTG